MGLLIIDSTAQKSLRILPFLEVGAVSIVSIWETFLGITQTKRDVVQQ